MKMFSSDLKKFIAHKIEEILKDTNHHELPTTNIQFILHVDGSTNWRWANIRNNNPLPMEIPQELFRNMTVK